MTDIYGTPQRYNSRQAARLKQLQDAITNHRTSGKHLLANKRERNQIKAAGRANVMGGDPTGPRTTGDIQREASSAADLRYGAAERGLNDELNISQQQHGNIDNWYQQYLNTVQQAHDATAQAYAGAQQRLQEATAASQAAFGAQQAAQQASMQEDAAKRGATVDPNIAATAAQAQASNRSSADLFGGLIGAQGANQTSRLDNQKVIGAADQIAQHLLENRRAGKTRQQLRDLLTEKGNYRVQQIGLGRDAERKAKLENAAFGLDVQKAGDAAANARADSRYKQGNQRIAAGNLAERQRHDLAMENKPSGGKGGPSDATKRSAIKTFGQVKGNFDGNTKPQGLYVGDKKVNGQNVPQYIPLDKGHENELVHRVQAKLGDPYLAKALVQQAIYGGVGPNTEKAIHHRYKVPLKSLGLNRMKPKAKPSPTPVGANGNL